MKLAFNHLTKKYGNFTVVDDLNLELECGIYGLLGLNGAGKTTLMRMICTLIQPTEGNITCDGNDIFDMDGLYRKNLGYLPQEFGYYPDLTVWDYLMYIASIKGIRLTIAKKRAKELLVQVGMQKEEKMKMRKLSGGMLRRVGIAQAMMNNPKILILDEPTAGLDPNERIRFRNLISELANERLVILSTHIVSDVEFVANQIILMNSGKIFSMGTAEEIVEAMQTRVWSCTVSRKAADYFMKNSLVANAKSTAEGVELRILSEESPIVGARCEVATLEDAFLYYFGKKAGEMK